MKKIFLLAVMAVASMGMFAGSYYFQRQIARSVGSDIFESKSLVDYDFFTAPSHLHFNSLVISAYAKCNVSGANFDGTQLRAIASFAASRNGSQINDLAISRIIVQDQKKEAYTPYMRVCPYLYGTNGYNGLLLGYYMWLPAGMFGTMETGFRIHATYVPIY